MKTKDTRIKGPTTWMERFMDALQMLCNGKTPPLHLCEKWVHHYESGNPDEETLQHWVISNRGGRWAQGIVTIDAATLLADEPAEGEDHEGIPKRVNIDADIVPSIVFVTVDDDGEPNSLVITSVEKVFSTRTAAVDHVKNTVFSNSEFYSGCDRLSLERLANQLVHERVVIGQNQPSELSQEKIDQAMAALSPFADIGAWLFARNLPDDTPAVEVRGLNGSAGCLTRGQFKAAFTALRLLEESIPVLGSTAACDQSPQ